MQSPPHPNTAEPGGNHPADANGAHTDAPGPTRAVTETVDALTAVLATLEMVTQTSVDERVRRPAADAALPLTSVLAHSATPAFSTARLRVALMGRTKAGKSQLVAALAGEREPTGVGRGRHRTTLTERVTALDGFDLVDLPGVGALGGEADTALAVASAATADAVLWLYAESLQEAEGAELEALLRRGKPIVVAYNAKWAIDDAKRRLVFTKHPELAFRDLATHEERVAQIAARAGARVLPMVPVHARASWYAMRDDDTALRHASRVDDLVLACDQALVARAAVLRIRASHDRPRHRLEDLAGTAQLAVAQLSNDGGALAETLGREAAAMSRAADKVRQRAEHRLDAAAATARRGVRGWVEGHRGASEDELDTAWRRYLQTQDFAPALERYADDLRREIARCEAAARLAELADWQQLHPDSGHHAAPDRGWRGGLATALRASRNALVSGVRALGLERGLAILLAKIGGRAVPGVGWWLIGIDAASGLSKGLRDELGARRLRAEEWRTDTERVCADQLAWAHQLALSTLTEADRAVHAEIAERLRQEEHCVDATAGARRELQQAATAAETDIAACDRDLVTALLTHSGSPLDVMAVHRIPNRSTRVSLRGNGDRTQALTLLTLHLAPETVSESSVVREHSPRRRSSRRSHR